MKAVCSSIMLEQISNNRFFVGEEEELNAIGVTEETLDHIRDCSEASPRKSV
jgi:hypothetical protein